MRERSRYSLVIVLSSCISVSDMIIHPKEKSVKTFLKFNRNNFHPEYEQNLTNHILTIKIILSIQIRLSKKYNLINRGWPCHPSIQNSIFSNRAVLLSIFKICFYLIYIIEIFACKFSTSKNYQLIISAISCACSF